MKKILLFSFFLWGCGDGSKSFQNLPDTAAKDSATIAVEVRALIDSVSKDTIKDAVRNEK